MCRNFRAGCWRIRLGFAALGSGACTAAALLPEPLFGIHVVQNQFERAGTPPLLFLSEGQRRLVAAGAHTGEPEVSLFWENMHDLDLHVVEPSGEHLYFAHRRSRTGGELDVDMNVHPMTRRPVEHIYWPVGSAPAGAYHVYVHHYKNHGIPDPSAFRVEVRNGGRTQVYTGAVRYGDPLHSVASFTLSGHSFPWLVRLLRPGVIALVAVSALWAALLAAVLSLALLAGLRHLAPSPVREKALWSSRIVWGGLAAGAAGQALFSVLVSIFPSLPPTLERMLGCALMGLVLGAALGGRVPLLNKREAILAGGIAGALGGWAFGALGYALVGRLACAGMVGAAIGALICWHIDSFSDKAEDSIKPAQWPVGGSARRPHQSIRRIGQASGGARRAERNVASRSGQAGPNR